MQRFSPKASSVLEKKIFKGFYHIWAWPPSWSTNRNHFSNLSFPQPMEAPYEIWARLAQRRSRLKFWTFFQYKCIRKQNWPYHKKVKCQCATIIKRCLKVFPIQMQSEANLTLPKKGQMSIYELYFRKFGRPPIPGDLSKDSAPRHPRFWRRRFWKVFTIYGHRRHLGQWTVTILAIFFSPNLRRLHMKFEQNWLRGFRGEVVWKC